MKWRFTMFQKLTLFWNVNLVVAKHLNNYRVIFDVIRSLRQQVIDQLIKLANCHCDFQRYFMLTKILLYLGRVLVVQITRVFSPSTSARVLPFFLPFHSVSWAGCPKNYGRDIFTILFQTELWLGVSLITLIHGVIWINRGLYFLENII